MDDYYISRESATQAKPEFLNENCYDAEKALYAKGWNACNSAFINNLLAISAADVRPVVRGEWNRYEHDNELCANYCSICNIYLPIGMNWKPNFCPNCGAEMMGG